VKIELHFELLNKIPLFCVSKIYNLLRNKAKKYIISTEIYTASERVSTAMKMRRWIKVFHDKVQ
jgi:hypothetical protein